MSLATMEMFYVKCDECGKSASEGTDYAAWADRDGALNDAESADWSEHDGKHRCHDHNPFCERCGEDAGELSGERDYLCPSCWRIRGEAP